MTGRLSRWANPCSSRKEMLCIGAGTRAVAVSSGRKPAAANATSARENIQPTSAFALSHLLNERRSAGDSLLYSARISLLVMGVSRRVNGQSGHIIDRDAAMRIPMKATVAIRQQISKY